MKLCEAHPQEFHQRTFGLQLDFIWVLAFDICGYIYILQRRLAIDTYKYFAKH